jgi:hypothetical protein
MLSQKQRGRPQTSHNVRVTPEFRDNPDLDKLGRALIAVAMRIAEQKQAEEDAKKVQCIQPKSEEDNMT